MIKKIIILSFLYSVAAQAEIIINTKWKNHKVNDRIIEVLEEHFVIQRLKQIDVGGPIRYFLAHPPFSRYEHSVGVLALLDKFNAPVEEKTAGLLHDASHTAFSHIGDCLFYEANKEKSYQDIIHLEFLKKFGIEKIVEKYGIGLKDLDPDLPGYRALEQDLPDLCADRIQYIVHTGVIYNKISKEEAEQIIDDLNFEEGKWFFNSRDVAKKYALLTLDFTKNLYGAPWNCFFYEYFSEILKYSMKNNIISVEDIKYGVDEEIIKKLYKSEDPYITKSFANLKNIHNIFDVVDFGMGSVNIKPKFRGVDPLVKSGSSLKRLTELDNKYKKQYEEVKGFCAKGYGIKPNVNIKVAIY